ncbi:MAG: FtsX-like permease family protein [Mesorhizobium sp.]|uniref:ABC transporter permease n=1 Tax=Mesorhizobium sp. TaxID=1871066 RepID=UPI000FE8AF22|nr:FtsX-like permease family protein [Mesorhizobium sp.]RWJ35570.1 MAG: FtsX-like permease family protein [Mesorhizobium sp.]
MIWETVRLSLLSVRRNVLRSFLTLLGIVIGVAAVIAMLTIGSGTTEKVKADISKLGSNLLVVRPGRPAGQGEIIRVNRTSCKIIGLLEPKGYTGFGQDQDNVVLMPLAAYQRRIAGNRDIDSIYVAADDRTPTTELLPRVEDILRDTRRITPDREDDFSIRDMTQIADAMASATTTMTGMLGAVAGVSLLVGGIGIMNIMLVSVTERTREIGIRLAIGAHEKHILIQFLVEATVLSLLGGIIGILIGLALAGVASLTLAIPFAPSPAVLLLAVGFSALIGMVFGFFPALRGARLDPIDALRHE